ncbi:endosomal/lysosomal potassium channel TMEM175 isoform X6 [Choloepus didactylus]|uniref:endosomal/lysosomal potassium channel TMEM175 isoform X6 n=1 Tax=Choloepus didactylus TaxID=27675 RepID=UPI00189D5939|nr:endosomal/lysosomal potassium channel TMEM175 isoform X6 [Choloepus didactylus]
MSELGSPERTPDAQTPDTRDDDAGDGIQASQRMLSFSDALLSIIATVMVLPVMHTKIYPEQHFDRSMQKLLATKIAVYLMSFLIVTVAWAAHIRLFQVVGKIDDTLALLNLVCMMTITFLPYTSYLLLVLVIVLPYVSKAARWCQEHVRGPGEPPTQTLQFFPFDLHEPLSKERVEAFSDGVYAIVATLLILDICEDNVPDPAEVEGAFHGSLVAALGASRPRFLAYFGSFATVGLLWFAHHSLFLHVRKATQPMGLLNTLALAFVGGLPLAYRQTSALARRPREELESIRVSCVIIFFAGTFQFATWTAALLRQRETLHPTVWYGGREHALMFAKLGLYPCASLLAFASTCFLSRFSTAIFHLMQIGAPLAFLLLRLLLRLALAALRGLRGLAWPADPQPSGRGQDGDGDRADLQAQLLPDS